MVQNFTTIEIGHDSVEGGRQSSLFWKSSVATIDPYVLTLVLLSKPRRQNYWPLGVRRRYGTPQ
jgi:hypothetical protein